MIAGILIRFASGDQGTQGVLTVDGFQCRILELPWRENRPQVSSIPLGQYPVRICQSPRFGEVYWVQDVPGRSVIRIHQGNFAGDISKGYRSHSQGCLIIGRWFGVVAGQLAVCLSKPTLGELMDHLDYRPFILTVQDAYSSDHKAARGA